MKLTMKKIMVLIALVPLIFSSVAMTFGAVYELKETLSKMKDHKIDLLKVSDILYKR